ncbi:hypothetical protein BHE74_00017197 [Ensete ventricosum]|nr:hypothetical protein GW17_00009665 [Ensete ventricosum]RWW74839.1 hypothetical protein BHE74_00017197 [Ensete ventricosum]RZR88831.1 hypothetical protein BHM03_00016472 [Ensete ventricosum]
MWSHARTHVEQARKRHVNSDVSNNGRHQLFRGDIKGIFGLLGVDRDRSTAHSQRVICRGMQSDPAVISLRPGGGGNRGSRFLATRFDTGALGAAASLSSSGIPALRPHGGVGLALSLKVDWKPLLT